MLLANVWGRVYDHASDRASAAREAVQERIVVVGGGMGSLSLKLSLAVILVAFSAGVYAGIRWDASGFRAFKAEAAKLEARARERNDWLERQIDGLRIALDADEARRERLDRQSIAVLNRPATETCPAPATLLNPIIEEANR